MTPTPVDISKLKSILGNAKQIKQIMNKVETNSFKGGNIDPRIVSEDGINEMLNTGAINEETFRSSSSIKQPMQYTPEMVERTNLPPAIKKAMIEKQIPVVSNPLTHSFNLDDVSDLIEKPAGYPKPKGRVNENQNAVYSQKYDMITISRSELDNIIKENVIKILTDSYNRTITEDAIKKTVKLISEGKINIVKKK